MTNRRNEGPMSQRQFFGAELRHWREAGGMTQDELGESVICSGSLIAHFEAGRRIPQLDTARRLDDALGTGGALARMRRQLLKSKFAEHFAEAAELEAVATAIHEYAVSLVPGLLQTGEYARALLRTARPNFVAEEVDKHVANRLARAKILEDPGGPTVWVVFYEAVVRAVIGGPLVMADQLRAIARLGRRGRILVQVVPFSSGAHSAMGGMMSLMSFADAPDVVFTEGPYSGALIEHPPLVRLHRDAYDLARAVALPPEASLDLLESVAEDLQHEGRTDPRRLHNRPMAQEQLQQRQCGQLP